MPLNSVLAASAESGRMMPINTFSSEILRKIHKANTIADLKIQISPDQPVRYTRYVDEVPFIAYSKKEMATYYSLSEKTMCLY